MGTGVASRRFQGGSGALSSPLVARVVPDVSGIDKTFDYLVPTSIIGVLAVGDKVRINLHGRRVGGWVIALGEHGDDGFDDVPLAKLVEITKRSGQGVVPHLVPLAAEVASYYLGPLRAVLNSASAPKVMRSKAQPQHGKIIVTPDSVSALIGDRSVGTHVVTIHPRDSVLSLVAALAEHGPVLVVCPTIRMAMLGAASLRRRGCVVAVMPDDWDRGVDGVDVVIGARSAVWAPLSQLSAIVVVDEHDESLKEERVPTWHARDVAMRRARYENVPCYLCSPVVSAEAKGLVSRGEAQYASSDSPDGWPVITIADLRDVPVSGSLATSQMLQLVRRQGESVLCILNTKGKARLLACAACRTIARCPRCHAALSAGESHMHHCVLCDNDVDAVCSDCGRTSFRVLRSGIGRLREEIEKASGREVVEVDVATDVLDLALHDGVYVGTEALLHRVSGAQHVVFLDFDAEILAPRATATREAVALLIRASRIIGRSGSIVIQTRHVDHDLVVALSQVHHNPAVLDDWHNSDDAMRRLLSLPPYTVLARVRLDDTVAITDICDESHMTWARESDDTFIVRGRDVALIRESLSRARQEFGQHVRIDIDPVRY